MKKTSEKAVSVLTGTAILDEQGYEKLKLMFDSEDEENHLIGQMILLDYDVNKSLYWIWRLSKGYVFNMVNLRTKKGRAFRDATDVYKLSNYDGNQFAVVLEKRGLLTPELFKLLEQDIIDSTSWYTNHFYQVKLEIKDKYKHLTQTTCT